MIIILAIGSYYLIKIAPYHIYTLTLSEGVNTRFLVMNPSKEVLYDGSPIEYFKDDELLTSSKFIFKTLHLKNFSVSLPVNHPELSFIPKIKTESNRLKLGAYFIDSKYRTQFSFIYELDYKFETSLENQNLFLLPIFRNFIAKKSQTEIWSDLFSKKLSLPKSGNKSFFESLDELKEYSYQELVYNLYILNLRKKFIPEGVVSIKFDQELNIGLVKFENTEEEGLEKERFFILDQGIVYPVTVYTNTKSRIGKFSRNKLIKEIKIKNSSIDSAIPIYAEYKMLPYKDRIEEDGMMFLFTAWSHDTKNKDFIRVIIQFLERGHSNIKFLKPFYEYAFKKFGTSFASDKDFLKETQGEELKRKIHEEVEKEQLIESKKDSIKFDGEYESNDEKIKKLLQKAKDKKTNSDEKSMELSIE